MKSALRILIIMFVMFLTLEGTLMAMGQRPPKGSYAECNYQVEQTAKAAGVKSPWDGGNTDSWYKFTHPLYNDCRCRFYGKPYEGDTCKVV